MFLPLQDLHLLLNQYHLIKMKNFTVGMNLDELQSINLPLSTIHSNHNENVHKTLDMKSIEELLYSTLSISSSSLQLQLQSKHELKVCQLRICVTEGKYRMVRRILHNAGHSVLRLNRLRYGQILLNDLAVGEVRSATDEEINWARSLPPAPTRK
jgi:16S rRNA U516 pseudouridylate synthase RsuA-like enzyme